MINCLSNQGIILKGRLGNSNYYDLILSRGSYNPSQTELWGRCQYSSFNGEHQTVAQYRINLSGKNFALSSYNYIQYYNVESINGKNIPQYPSNTGTFTLKCVNGTLTWIEDI